MLWNLADHALIDTEARTNYKSIYGADVISRIQFCNQDDSNVTLLQQKVISCFNDILEDFLIRNQILPQQIYDVTIVGNTTMSHLVTGVHPRPLALAPFTPVFLEAPDLSTKELGLHVNPSANVYLLPNIAGHVGSDIVGMMLSCCPVVWVLSEADVAPCRRSGFGSDLRSRSLTPPITALTATTAATTPYRVMRLRSALASSSCWRLRSSSSSALRSLDALTILFSPLVVFQLHPGSPDIVALYRKSPRLSRGFWANPAGFPLCSQILSPFPCPRTKKELRR